MDCHQPTKLSLCLFNSDILKKKEKGKTGVDISQLFLAQHLNLSPMSREHPTWNPECRQSLNPALEPDGTTCLLCQPPPLFGCRVVVHVSLIRLTPSLGFEARRQRANSEDGGLEQWRPCQGLWVNRVMEQQWYPASAVGGGSIKGFPVYQKWWEQCPYHRASLV